MSRDEVITWLKQPLTIRKEYEELAAELAPLTETPLYGVGYARDKHARRQRDLSDYSMEIERTWIQVVSALLKYMRAINDLTEALVDIPHGDVLEMYYCNGYNQNDIAAEYGVCHRTVCRWIREGINALMSDTDLILKK